MCIDCRLFAGVVELRTNRLHRVLQWVLVEFSHLWIRRRVTAWSRLFIRDIQNIQKAALFATDEVFLLGVYILHSHRLILLAFIRGAALVRTHPLLGVVHSRRQLHLRLHDRPIMWTLAVRERHIEIVWRRLVAI